MAETESEPKEAPALLSMSQAARRLGIHVNTLRRWVVNGDIRAVRLPSGYRRFEPEVVEEKRRELGFRA